MQLKDEESELLKKWIITKLEDISDADSDVLADYVLALVTTEESDAIAKAACAANLKDFVPNGTGQFVDELFQAIATKSYDPNRPPLKPTAPTFQPFNGIKSVPEGQQKQGRKRAYIDRDAEENGDTRLHDYGNGGRPIKQVKRGGRVREQRGGRNVPQRQPQAPISSISQFPPLPPGIPPFDPANPLPAMMAMMQAVEYFKNNQSLVSPATQRCPNMETTGACADGLSCPYNHSNSLWNLPPLDVAYDPANTVFPDIRPSRVGAVDTNGPQQGRGRGRGRGRGGNNWRGGGRRSEYAQLGVGHDTSVTTVVVEGIPDDHCNDENVRAFFSDFGAIDDITVQADRSLALVKFSDRDSALAAYNSPKVVFDNRFVKVFMKKSENPADHFDQQNGEPAEGQDVEMEEDDTFDVEEFAKRQEEAQRKYEEATRQREEATKQRQAVHARLVEMEMERRELEALLARKTKTFGPSATDSPHENGSADDPEQTKALKMRLAKLEAEAKVLGIDPDAASTICFSNGYGHSYSNFRGRGGYRGRGRGRGRAQYGGYRGGFDGGWAGGGVRGGAVKRLDNRPKTVDTKFTSGTYDEHSQALREFLLFNGLETATISKHPGRDDCALVTFQQRFEGEVFMAAAAKAEVPHIGRVKMAWYKDVDMTSYTNGKNEQSEENVLMKGTSDPPASVAAEPEAIDAAVDEDFDRWS